MGLFPTGKQTVSSPVLPFKHGQGLSFQGILEKVPPEVKINKLLHLCKALHLINCPAESFPLPQWVSGAPASSPPL